MSRAALCVRQALLLRVLGAGAQTARGGVCESGYLADPRGSGLLWLYVAAAAGDSVRAASYKLPSTVERLVHHHFF